MGRWAGSREVNTTKARPCRDGPSEQRQCEWLLASAVRFHERNLACLPRSRVPRALTQIHPFLGAVRTVRRRLREPWFWGCGHRCGGRPRLAPFVGWRAGARRRGGWSTCALCTCATISCCALPLPWRREEGSPSRRCWRWRRRTRGWRTSGPDVARGLQWERRAQAPDSSSRRAWPRAPSGGRAPSCAWLVWPPRSPAADTAHAPSGWSRGGAVTAAAGGQRITSCTPAAPIPSTLGLLVLVIVVVPMAAHHAVVQYPPPPPIQLWFLRRTDEAAAEADKAEPPIRTG